MSQTAIEKIVQRHVVGLKPGARTRAGDFVTIRPRHIMTHDNTSAVMGKFREIGATRIADPRQPVFAIDHDIQNTTPENLGKYAKIEQFAKTHGVDFYPAGRGIAHQVMVEEGYITPGALVVGSDSHSNLYGALGAVGTPVVRTDAAAIWATGRTWWQVPDQVRVVLTGRLRPGASGKDVIVTLCGLFKDDQALNTAVEFHGEGVASLSVDERMTISNMTTEWGTLVGMFPFDEVLRDFLLERAAFFASREAGGGPKARYREKDVQQWWSERVDLAPDSDAFYARTITLDLSTVAPHVSGPNSVKVMTAAREFETNPRPINKAYLMSCVNARLSDFAAAAGVFRPPTGERRRVSEGVEFYVAAASSEVERRAKEAGYWDTLMAAGAKALPAGCGACIGLGAGTLQPGEVGISATNRNFEGRMGSRDALCFLASPEVVAESAIRGRIAAPRAYEGEPKGSCTSTPAPQRQQSAQEIIDGFPARVAGRALYLPLDNLNTDGIYGKDVTYRDDITPEQQGQYAMLNYDPLFQEIAKRGDILVGGRNFGTGSSREQAATALASRGIAMVIAASFSETYKRNAFNNGFVCIDCPGLVDDLAKRFAAEQTTGVRTIVGPAIEVDFGASVVRANGHEHPFAGLSPTAQELIVAGGSEALVKRSLAAAG